MFVTWKCYLSGVDSPVCGVVTVYKKLIWPILLKIMDFSHGA